MNKVILVTGATDGIGLATAKSLTEQGHTVLLHGRNEEKLALVKQQLKQGGGQVNTYCADLSDLTKIKQLAQKVLADFPQIDVLINNAGVLKVSQHKTTSGLDVRFVVNTLSPYLLTSMLLAHMPADGRVINLSSAAQAPVNIAGLKGEIDYSDDMAAYAQSKLAITIWTRELAKELGDSGPILVAVNPASLLGSKMVKQGFGIAGKDLSIGVDILVRAALSDEFINASGKYFDNDSGQFANPHPDALKQAVANEVMREIQGLSKPYLD